MKTSIVLIFALLFNTAILLGEPLSTITETIGTWQFVVLELVLLVSFIINGVLKGLKKDLTFDFGNLNVFVFKGKKSKDKEKRSQANLF